VTQITFNMNLTDEQLIEIYHIIFTDIHSPGFMISEIKDLLFDPTYWFLTKPKDNWNDNLIDYLSNTDFDTRNLNMNPNLIP
jgi:hypothetical protein